MPTAHNAARRASRSAVRSRPLRALPAPAVSPEISKFLDGFKLPGVDLKSILEGRRADLHAVALANQRAHDAVQTLARHQDEMLRQAAADWRMAVRDLGAMDADALRERRTQLAGQAIRKALAGVRKLAEISARSQALVWEAIGERYRNGEGK